MNRIENEFEHINNVLLKSAGAGLSLTVALHEMEKIILELKRVVESQRPSQRVLSLVERLFNLIEAFAEIVKKYPDTVFVMTGKSENEDFMQKMTACIKQYNLQNKIILPGFVNSEEFFK